MAIDVFPTVARLIGAPLPDHAIDGLDIWSLLSDPSRATSPHEALFFYYHKNHLEALRAGRWKLHLPHSYRTMEGRELGSGGTPGKYNYQARVGLELYDLENDVGESRDLAASRPEKVAELLDLVEAQRARLGDALTKTAGDPFELRAAGRVEEL
jgi:arylsulfatase A-like enzyme